MKLHPIFAVALVSGVFSLQAWTIKTVVDLRVSVATLTERVDNAVQRVQFGQVPSTNCGVQATLSPRSEPKREKTLQEPVAHGATALVQNLTQKSNE